LAQRLAALLLLATIAAGCAAPGAAEQVPTTPPPPAAPVANAELEHGLACPSAGGPIDDPIVVNQGADLVSVGLDSGQLTPLTALPSINRAYAPVWAPDGETLAFAFFFAPVDPAMSWLQTGMICGLDRQTGQGRILARGATPTESLEEASWTPDGQALVLTVMSHLFNASNELTGTATLLARYDLRTGSVAPLVRDAIRPTLSPDGRQLAFIKLDMQTVSVERVLMVAAADGSQPRTLLSERQGFRMLESPRWSPDGERLLVTASTDTAGGAPARSWLAALFGVSTAAAHGDPANIWLVSAADGQVRQVTATAADDPHAAWGPGGEQIVYVTTLGAVVSHDLSTKHERQLTQPGFAGLIDWKWHEVK
jgi:Tol biopolymer transport system component